ncbi:MAG: helix-turn-helix transcriptional regulator [Thiobacillus sp.]|nr:helix-turn-helix transcriptional regulator [Thiobacillus sp.]
MSPFSLLLKEFRVSRGLKQIELADRLGYEPSYLSALERSEKGPPRQDFITRLIRGLQLSDDEQRRLAEALRASCRQTSLPAKASLEEYAFVQRLRPQLGSLHPLQLELLDIALRLPEEMGADFSKRLPSDSGHSAKAEVPKM